MSRPSVQDVAKALGVPLQKVHQLRSRGMPTKRLREAVEWFEKHGMRQNNQNNRSA